MSVKSLKTPLGVIPAKAGIQYFQVLLDACLCRACPCRGRGRTRFWTFYGIINFIKDYIIVECAMSRI